MIRSIWIGYEPRETDAYLVSVQSIRKHARQPILIQPVLLADLREKGFYWRDTQVRKGRMFDSLSDAPMSTEFALSRFLTPILAGTGWALFMDCDTLVRSDIHELFDLADSSKAVLCVQHDHQPEQDIKMDDQIQLRYRRKNWSSVMLFNCDHPANRRLTLGLVNSLPGRDLHAFCWLEDSEIGRLGPEWNYLVGHKDQPAVEPKIVHFTSGLPRMHGYADSEFAAEWNQYIREVVTHV